MLSRKKSIPSKSSSETRSHEIQNKYCVLGICDGAPKWKAYGVMSKDVVQYSNLLKQRRKFQHLMEINASQISNRKSWCCIVDKNYSVKGSNIDIFIFDENEYQSALCLEYFIDEQSTLKNCNKLLTFLNFRKTSVFRMENSSIYVKSANGLKWQLFYDLLEFFLKKFNKSILGSQFYCPLTSKYLIMNEFQLLRMLQNKSKTVNLKKISVDISSQASISGLGLKGLPTKKSIEMKTGKKNLSDGKYAPEAFILKRKSFASNEKKRKMKRLSCESVGNPSCHCQSKPKHEWKIFKSLENNPIRNYTDILKTKNLLNDSNTACVIPFDSSFDADNAKHSDSQVSLNKDPLTICHISKNELPTLSLAEFSNAKKTVGVYFPEAAELPTFKHKSDLCNHKEIEPTVCGEESPIMINYQQYQTCSSNTKSFPKNLDRRITVNITEEEKNIAGPFRETLPISFASFHTARGKAVKISEKSLKVAEKMFEEICSQELDFSEEKISESTLQNNQKGKEFHVKKKEYVDEDISSILSENFFEDIPFDEREIECNPTDMSVKSDNFKTPQIRKTKKSLGGRRSLKPYTFNK
ncbi:uncharacterized protein NPIL_27181 [Nephila pilipes]|uniref:Uncharacterized protein n=1 Tax=Nephila pilipes TaxID=299642 RepID=A0A8X6QM27_NEPPI|nr:uncharacterized protein NPIL_27181 [Nephila pilipes]